MVIKYYFLAVARSIAKSKVAQAGLAKLFGVSNDVSSYNIINIHVGS